MINGYVHLFTAHYIIEFYSSICNVLSKELKATVYISLVLVCVLFMACICFEIKLLGFVFSLLNEFLKHPSLCPLSVVLIL